MHGNLHATRRGAFLIAMGVAMTAAVGLSAQAAGSVTIFKIVTAFAPEPTVGEPA